MLVEKLLALALALAASARAGACARTATRPWDGGSAWRAGRLPPSRPAHAHYVYVSGAGGDELPPQLQQLGKHGTRATKLALMDLHRSPQSTHARLLLSPCPAGPDESHATQRGALARPVRRRCTLPPGPAHVKLLEH
jgi:hypothetical protein